ncbi:LL-diaminopimelate aminotransferase apoenzyme [Acetitomaculum ruminis DSM 5522]|uniref:LL-diaminopimelate aminotransferase n=1 Tax=Acetitomaculum ruminis DSM 5522 TaxID=1120918 RepID=A0A1I1AF24_9FIRM|nr:LL-diaminopimelate aminotransferase [Acetitomaculum ruminis]SFB35976.1 LL-diaminopimelate aminotransferase apoenzyme [Acetitomaculum ruminis DSM 5522]
MPKLNENYLNLKESYLFSEIANRVNKYKKENPDKNVISLGIGDVTLPLGSEVIDALHEGVNDLSKAETFMGYGPEHGYMFLREAIVDYYKRNGVDITAEEVFISDGAKSDTGNITDMFGPGNVILIPDPTYPVYVDSNMMNGREITYMDASEKNDFLAMPDKNVHADIIYICSPNNPTGAVYNHAQLKEWVDYALENDAIILFDSAYEAFISDPDLPRSIFAIEGAKKCAIEFCSLSKTAGFTGARCGYTIVPEDLKFTSSTGKEMSLNAMWNRRQSTKFNGASYIVQKGAAKAFTKEGMAQCQENIAYYKENARLIAECLKEKNIRFYGGINSPYIWFECPNNMESWDFFDYLLNNAQIVGTPGAGFGKNGTHYFRLTSFGNRENTIEAIERLNKLL